MKKLICKILGHKIDNPWQYYGWHTYREWANKQICLRCEYRNESVGAYIMGLQVKK